MKLSDCEEMLVSQILDNMAIRNFVNFDEQDREQVDLYKSELRIMLMHHKKMVYEDVSDFILQKAIDFKELPCLRSVDRGKEGGEGK